MKILLVTILTIITISCFICWAMRTDMTDVIELSPKHLTSIRSFASEVVVSYRGRDNVFLSAEKDKLVEECPALRIFMDSADQSRLGVVDWGKSGGALLVLLIRPAQGLYQVENWYAFLPVTDKVNSSVAVELLRQELNYKFIEISPGYFHFFRRVPR